MRCFSSGINEANRAVRVSDIAGTLRGCGIQYAHCMHAAETRHVACRLQLAHWRNRSVLPVIDLNTTVEVASLC